MKDITVATMLDHFFGSASMTLTTKGSAIKH